MRGTDSFCNVIDSNVISAGNEKLANNKFGELSRRVFPFYQHFGIGIPFIQGAKCLGRKLKPLRIIAN